MKLRIIVKAVEKLFGMAEISEGHRADMYMPDRLLAMSIVFFAGGLASIVLAVVNSVNWVIGIVIGLILGAAALLCWKNQSIHIISDEQFTYTTMFGNTRTYYFSDIRGLRRNPDSMTLFIADDKVHIESMAVLSDRLIDRINTQLEKLS